MTDGQTMTCRPLYHNTHPATVLHCDLIEIKNELPGQCYSSRL